MSAPVAESPSPLTAMPIENTAPIPATLCAVSKVVDAMSDTLFSSELQYQTASAIARNLRDQGLLTQEEYTVIDTILLQKFNPTLGTLLSDNSLII